jgi:hypothetical protein
MHVGDWPAAAQRPPQLFAVRFVHLHYLDARLLTDEMHVHHVLCRRRISRW